MGITEGERVGQRAEEARARIWGRDARTPAEVEAELDEFARMEQAALLDRPEDDSE